MSEKRNGFQKHLIKSNGFLVGKRELWKNQYCAIQNDIFKLETVPIPVLVLLW